MYIHNRAIPTSPSPLLIISFKSPSPLSLLCALPVNLLNCNCSFLFFKIRKVKTLGLLTAAAAKSLQSCPTVRPQRRQPTRLPRPWDSPGKNTGVGCHSLLQCMKVKSESDVAQSCPTLHDPMDCSPPGSSIHGLFQARVLEWVAITFSALPQMVT